MSERIFTLTEARSLIPQVAPIIEEFATKQRRLQSLQTLMETIRRSAASNGGSAHADTREQEQETAELGAELRRMLQALHDLGAELKDPGARVVGLPRSARGAPRLPMLAPRRTDHRLVARDQRRLRRPSAHRRRGVAGLNRS